jgi:hypothetical protein
MTERLVQIAATDGPAPDDFTALVLYRLNEGAS